MVIKPSVELLRSRIEVMLRWWWWWWELRRTRNSCMYVQGLNWLPRWKLKWSKSKSNQKQQGKRKQKLSRVGRCMRIKKGCGMGQKKKIKNVSASKSWLSEKEEKRNGNQAKKKTNESTRLDPARRRKEKKSIPPSITAPKHLNAYHTHNNTIPPWAQRNERKVRNSECNNTASTTLSSKFRFFALFFLVLIVLV